MPLFRRRRPNEAPISYDPRDQPPPLDEHVLALFHERDSVATEVGLRDGRYLTVHNIAWRYDVGDEYAHVTTNASPFVAGADIDVFFTNEVVVVRDPQTARILFDAEAGSA